MSDQLDLGENKLLVLVVPGVREAGPANAWRAANCISAYQFCVFGRRAVDSSLTSGMPFRVVNFQILIPYLLPVVKTQSK